MKIVLTGSLGNVTRPLSVELVGKAHAVTVISSKTERQAAIEALGATAAIGSVLDVNFLTETFKGADVVYLMEPPINFFDQNADTETHWTDIAKTYAKAILLAGITKVIHLSSVGAHTNKDNGMFAIHYKEESILKELPDAVAIKFMRPVGFYTNIFRSMQTIKTRGAIVANYGGDKKEPWVSPLDIASTIAEEIELPFKGRTFRYIASEELSPNEIAKILGKAIGQPDLKWVVVSDEELVNGMLQLGINPGVAKGFAQMQAFQGSGRLYEDYYRYPPVLGKTKFAAFAEDFAKVFNHQ